MRADLLALTPEAVAALANLGLVKRALKEIEGGKGPSLSEADDGTVTGTFEDGVTTRLVPGKTLKDNPCSCPAVGVCRHRVAVALAYRGWAQSAAKPAPESTRSSADAAKLSGEADKPSGEANKASGEANEASGEANEASGETNKASALDDEPTRVSDEDAADRPARALAADETRDEPARDTRAAEPTAAYGPGVRTAEALAPPPFERWSPGAIQDEAVRVLLGKRAYDDAQTSRKRGIVVEVVRCTPEQPMPTARLPACTVRFLVPRELAYARCDCQVGQGCVHVALAVWAFREADAIDAERLTVAVELHAPEARGAKRRGAADDLRPMLELLEELADTGVVAAREAMAQKFVLAGERLGKAGYVWPATGLEDLAWMLARYRARSARYHAADALALVTELVARARVASRDPELGAVELPLRYVLGQGEAMETKLDHLRLVSLGARLESDARERTADVLLADPDTGTVMVLSRRWEFGEGEAMPEGPELARRRVAGSSTLGQLAAGQIVTRVARRRANRSLTIGQSSVGSTSVTPQTGDFSALPQPLRVDSVRELAAHLVAQPPAMLRPRVLAESVHAVRVAAVGSVGFDAGAQRLVGEVFDRDGTRLF
ncbi:MAG: hypothetical protein K1X94_27530, partial [Sandaracinaceae bacterium]|nr:hypothetical protein [Sandaracinaceae bacterium]